MYDLTALKEFLIHTNDIDGMISFYQIIGFRFIFDN